MFFRRLLEKSKYIKKTYSKDEYNAEQIKNATQEFDHNVESLCNRVVKKGLDIEKIMVSGIGRDPKLFKMQISDGQRNLFARSVFAAESSDKMIAHF